MGAHNGDLSDKLQKDITTQRQDATFNALHMEVQAVRLNQPLPDKRASWWDTSHPHDQEFKPNEYNSTRVLVAVACASLTANNKFTQQLCNGRPATEALTTVPNDVFVRVAVPRSLSGVPREYSRVRWGFGWF